MRSHEKILRSEASIEENIIKNLFSNHKVEIQHLKMDIMKLRIISGPVSTTADFSGWRKLFLWKKALASGHRRATSQQNHRSAD